MELVFPLLILFMIGLLFMSSRQRKKQQQNHDALTSKLAVGDVVLMSSGISGTVVDVDDERTIDVEIAEDVVTTWLRAAVRERLVEETEDADGVPDTAEALTRADAPADGPPAGASPEETKSDLTKSDLTKSTEGSSRSS
jgi:preprotein translocase subunit YajC